MSPSIRDPETLSQLRVRAGRDPCAHRYARTDVRRVCSARVRRHDGQNLPSAVHWVPSGRAWSDQVAARILQSAGHGAGATAEWSRRYIEPPNDELYAFLIEVRIDGPT